MKTRQNRWNGGIIGNEDYLEVNNIVSASQNYTRNVGCFVPGLTASFFTRPSEWRELPGMTQGDQIFAGLFAVYDHDSNFLAFTCRGAYQVDWGDGTSNTYADNTTAYKIYNRTTYAGLTSDVYDGYKNLIVRITPQAGQTLTSIVLPVKHNQANLTNYVNQWLDIKIAAPSLTTLNVSTDNTNGIIPSILKQFEYVGTNQLTNLGVLFAYCTDLAKIKAFHTSSVTNMYRMHFQCYILEEVPTYDTRNVTSFEEMFMQCLYLRKIPPLVTSKATNMYRFFYDCRSIGEIPILDTSSATDMRAMFEGCQRLETIPWMDTRKVTTMEAMFRRCYSLRKIPFLNTSNVTNMGSMFNDCIVLEYLPPLDFSKVTSLSYTFAGTYLKKFPYLNTSTALTNINYMAYFATDVSEINFANTTNVTTMQGAFANTFSLKTITGLNTAKVTNMQEAFAQCNLEQIPELQFDALINASNVFYASRATSYGNTAFNLPRATTLYGFFRFSGVRECPPINAPNSLSLEFAFDSSGLRSLRGITIASGVSLASFSSSGFNNTFNNCGALNTIPNFNLSGLSGAFTTVFTNMFNGCKSLGTLNGITGIAYNFSIANAKMSATALNQLYNGLAVVGASGSNTRTVTVTGNWGASAALGHLPSIAIEKGWQVTG